MENLDNTRPGEKQPGGYGKRPIWHWILFYAIFAIVAYGVIYYFFFTGKGGHSGSQPSYSYQQPQTPAATSAATGATAGAANPSSAAVTYTDSGFYPETVTVHQGDTVVFKNSAGDAFWPASNVHPVHSAYDGTTLQQHCANPTATTFDACGPVQPGSSWSFTFAKTGTWQYHNHLDPGEGGTVIVQ